MTGEARERRGKEGEDNPAAGSFLKFSRRFLVFLTSFCPGPRRRKCTAAEKGKERKKKRRGMREKEEENEE